MASKSDTNWYQNYEALKDYIQERGHLPDKHKIESRALLSWAKYQRKKIKESTLDDEKRELFESLLDTRSTEHTGGRKQKNVAQNNNEMDCIGIVVSNTVHFSYWQFGR